jgi:hypothetical protein
VENEGDSCEGLYSLCCSPDIIRIISELFVVEIFVG